MQLQYRLADGCDCLAVYLMEIYSHFKARQDKRPGLAGELEAEAEALEAEIVRLHLESEVVRGTLPPSNPQPYHGSILHSLAMGIDSVTRQMQALLEAKGQPQLGQKLRGIRTRVHQELDDDPAWKGTGPSVSNG